MTDLSPRFALPLLIPGQAQKEMFHNEALASIDAALHAVVEGTQAIPPMTPAPGQAWIVGVGAGGAWLGHVGQLASWTVGGWRFIVPPESMTVWDKAAGLSRRWSASGWSDGAVAASKLMVGGQQVVGTRQPAPPSPSGGTVIDAEARAALLAVTVALRTHGLID